MERRPGLPLPRSITGGNKDRSTVATSTRPVDDGGPVERSRQPSGLAGWLSVVGPGVGLVVALSLWGLTTKEAWHDEALSVAATRDLRRTLQNTAGTMASFYLMLKAWIQVSDSLWWIRLLAVIHTAGAVLALGVLAVRLRGAQVARWACLAMASTYLVVRYAQEVRSFALATLVVVLAWWALDHLVGGGGRRWILVHVAMCALVPATHGLAVIPILAQVVALVLAGVGWRIARRASVGIVASLAVVGFLYLIGGDSVGAGQPLTWANGRDLLERTHGGHRVWSVVDLTEAFDVRTVLFGFSLLGVVVGLVAARRAAPGTARFRALTPSVWAVGTIGGLMVLSIVHPSMLWRYAIPALPALALLQVDAAFAVHRRLWRLLRLPSDRWRWVPLIPALVVGLHLTSQIPLHEPQQNPWTETADVLEAQARSGDGIVVPHRSARMPLDYAWSQRDGDLPELVSVNPVQPLGVPRRFDNYRTMKEAIDMAGSLDRLWLVELDRDPRNPGVVRFMELLDADHHFEKMEEHHFRGVIVTLLERSP